MDIRASSSTGNSALDAEIANCAACRKQIRKVFPQMLMEKQHREPSIYHPIFVSIGPYHHGKPELCRAEAFKYRCLDRFGPDKELLYKCVLERINEIRDCYAQVAIVNKYDNDALAWIMILDSCFMITYMETITCTRQGSWDDWLNCFGLAASRFFVARDIMVLENQIPFFVLKLVIGLKYEKEKGKELVGKSLISWIKYVELKHDSVSIPREDEDPPIHFLEAQWRVLVEYPTTEPGSHHANESNYHFFAFSNWFKHRPQFMTTSWKIKKQKIDINGEHTYIHGWGSVMDLKAKGIKLRPSASHSLLDIKFISRPLYGQLQLPTRYLSDQTPVVLSNMIAYEISPDNRSDHHVVLSYVIFMKSLIQTVEDVKELQKNGVFRIKRFSNQNQVVELFKNINTFGVGNMNIYEHVMHRVGQHCNSKARTWMADLVHGKLRSPWTILGLLSATLLLILTFLQTFYTLHPVK